MSNRLYLIKRGLLPWKLHLSIRVKSKCVCPKADGILWIQANTIYLDSIFNIGRDDFMGYLCYLPPEKHKSGITHDIYSFITELHFGHPHSLPLLQSESSIHVVYHYILALTYHIFILDLQTLNSKRYQLISSYLFELQSNIFENLEK